MFKKKEGYVTKANRQMLTGKVPEAYRTLIDGLDNYQNKIVNALCPYPTADAALLVVTLRTMADSVYAANPNCQALVEDITKRFTGPQIEYKERIKPTETR